jgi:hypothetical protein
MDPSIRDYADVLYEQSLHQSASLLQENKVEEQRKMAARRSSYPLPLSGPEVQRMVVLFVEHVERCVEARLESYRKAYATARRNPTSDEFNEILTSFQDAWKLQIAHAVEALEQFIKQGASGMLLPDYDLKGDLTGRTAHGHDRVLRDWKVWRGEVRLKGESRRQRTFEDPYPITLEEVEAEIDDWASQRHEGQPGSDFDQNISNRLEHLRHLHARYKENQKRSEASLDAAQEPSRGNQKVRRTATVLEIIIASPSDVHEEREIAVRVIDEWNAVHSREKGIVLQAVRWETHSYPASGDRPQAIINRQIVDAGDILIGIFGRRIGTPTGEAQSGTIEEIERFRRAGKYVALYFSTADVPRDADREQLKALEDYKRQRESDTLFGTFRTLEDLHRRLAQDVPRIVTEVSKSLDSSAHPHTSAVVGTEDPARLATEFLGEYPDTLRLCVTSDRPIRLTKLDYLDGRDVRILSEELDVEGQDFEVAISYDQLTKLGNLFPRSNSMVTIPIGFRLHFRDGHALREKKIPSSLNPSFKMIGNTQTYFFKLLG